ncbi:MAG: 16S rRNA (guanine(966)-N(2))-methyltransferase RsmD [Thermodesulfobacteriota bacterium]
MSVRIIAGTAKGRKLLTAGGWKTRPTANRAREAIFNIISAKLKEAVVLDLFAGTGAFGIEALSRGAAFALFIDNDRQALALIEKNVHSCYMESRSRLIGWNILKNLECIRAAAPPFNLVFMDPPYGRNYVEVTLRHLDAAGALEKGAVIVIEHDHSDPLPGDIPGYIVYDQRRYGRAMVTFARHGGG